MKRTVIISLLSSIITFALIAGIFFNEKNTIIIAPGITFKSSDNGFHHTCYINKGCSYKDVERLFDEYLKSNDLNSEIRLLRVSRRNYLNINMWCHYKNRREWHYPRR